MTIRTDDLSIDEKISLLSGDDYWRTVEIADKGIFRVKLTDGPNGVRGDLSRAVNSACFPAGVALGATWDPEIVREIGIAIAQEVKQKNCHVLLAPTINLQRTPIGGRNFECFSEDPCLTGELAVAFVQGVQSEGVGSCPKHFVGNDTEFERLTISSNIDARTLREVYLSPFERVITEAKPWMVMSGYNRVNGTYMSSHRELLVDVLKTEWGFDGVVVSDWGAALDTVGNANGGLDLEMPGPTRVWGQKLRSAIENGEVDIAEIDDKVSRVLRLIDRASPEPNEAMLSEHGVDMSEHRSLIRQAACASMVLLKNAGSILPLKNDEVREIAIIGPNANIGQIMGGGSSFVNSHSPVHPLDGLRKAFPTAKIHHERGCTNYKYLPTFPVDSVTPGSNSGSGFLIEWFAGDEFDGTPIKTDIIPQSKIRFLDSTTNSAGIENQAIRLSGQFLPLHSGEQLLGLLSAGKSILKIDGKIVIDNWKEWAQGDSFYGFGSSERRATYTFDSGRSYLIEIEFLRASSDMVAGVQFGLDTPLPDNSIALAAEAAAQSDTSILVLGSNSDWESEGCDRSHFGLPGEQDELAQAVLDANPNTIIVLNVGAAVSMPWYDKAQCVLVSWFPGQEFGNSLADVLTGDSEPAGRLPFTWPSNAKEHPSLQHYPGVDGNMNYGEGLLIGYRGYDHLGIAPLSPFGGGLGFGDIELLSADFAGKFAISALLRNDSDFPTRTTVQVYARPKHPKNGDAALKLVGFSKVDIGTNSEGSAHIQINPKNLREWDSQLDTWREDIEQSLFVSLSAAGPFVEVGGTLPMTAEDTR